MATQSGLRERKKRQTRELIAESAQRLFVERGFDSVTVAEIARRADVSEGTVFNYFPTKEHLFFGPMEAFESRLVEAVRMRPPHESLLDAFRRAVLDGTERLASEEVNEMIARAARLIAASPALKSREREIVADATQALAALIAEETADDDAVGPLVVANALMGVQRALVQDVHSRISAGESGPTLAEHIRSQAAKAFALLERGLSDYAK